MQKSSDYLELLTLTTQMGLNPKLIKTWIPVSKFVEAQSDGASLSITRIDDPYYGMAFGPNPMIDSRWRTFSVTRGTPKELTKDFQINGQWDAYGIDTQEFPVEYQVIEDFNFINSFIEQNAPQSSIRAEDEEVLAWIGISDVALGALCKWESGFYVLSAIVVAENQRGKGHGKEITKALIDYAFKNGVTYVALGVFAKNIPAIATYRSLGFELLGQFNSFIN